MKGVKRTLTPIQKQVLTAPDSVQDKPKADIPMTVPVQMPLLCMRFTELSVMYYLRVPMQLIQIN